jgi:hypothetical protein
VVPYSRLIEDFFNTLSGFDLFAPSLVLDDLHSGTISSKRERFDEIVLKGYSLYPGFADTGTEGVGCSK